MLVSHERYEIGSTVTRESCAMEPTKTREIMVDFLTNISVAG